MRPFTAGELAGLQGVQEAAMMDTCQRLVYVKDGVDEYGQPVDGYAAGPALPCGYNATATRQVMQGAEVVVTDARLRLPVGAQIDPKDRVRITHRFGEALAAGPVYEIIGEPRRGPSGLVLDLRLVTNDGG